MSDPFTRMHNRLFASIGKEAVLRAIDPCKVSITNGVGIAGEYGEISAYRTVAEILYAGIAKPKKGDALVVGDATYLLDAEMQDDGYTAKWLCL